MHFQIVSSQYIPLGCIVSLPLEIPIGRILRKTDANCLFFCLFCGVIVGCRNHDMDIINTNARAGQKNRTRCHEVTDHLLRTNIDRRVNWQVRTHGCRCTLSYHFSLVKDMQMRIKWASSITRTARNKTAGDELDED